MDKPNKSEGFVEYIIKLVQENKAASAAIKYADHQTLSYKSWEYLASFMDIEKENERLSYGVIGAAIAKNKIKNDGTVGIGKAIRYCCGTEVKAEDAVEKSKLIHLLSCGNTRELCLLLRRYIPFIESKVPGKLSYSQLLQDSLYFGDKIKTKWAIDFYKQDNSIDGESQNDTDAN